jgi:hypothetical protein
MPYMRREPVVCPGMEFSYTLYRCMSKFRVILTLLDYLQFYDLRDS